MRKAVVSETVGERGVEGDKRGVEGEIEEDRDRGEKPCC